MCIDIRAVGGSATDEEYYYNNVDVYNTGFSRHLPVLMYI